MKSLIVLSGCSGAGKTTFWNFLKQNSQAEAQIISAIPHFDIDAANLLDATKPLRKAITRDITQVLKQNSGLLVLHYDITHVYRIGLKRFEQDPALKLLSHFDHVDFIHLQTPPEKLRQQFEERSIERIKAGLKKNNLSTKIRSLLRRLTAFMRNRQFMSEDEIYADEASIQNINNSWLDYIKTTAPLDPGKRIIMIKPTDNMNFEIVPT